MIDIGEHRAYGTMLRKGRKHSAGTVSVTGAKTASERR